MRSGVASDEHKKFLKQNDVVRHPMSSIGLPSYVGQTNAHGAFAPEAMSQRAFALNAKSKIALIVNCTITALLFIYANAENFCPCCNFASTPSISVWRGHHN